MKSVLLLLALTTGCTTMPWDPGPNSLARSIDSWAVPLQAKLDALGEQHLKNMHVVQVCMFNIVSQALNARNQGVLSGDICEDTGEFK